MTTCPASAPFFGFMGITSALVFSNLGAAYGTAKSSVGIASMGVMNADSVMKNILPVIMAGILGIYGLIIGVILNNNVIPIGYSSFSGHLLNSFLLFHTDPTRGHS
eukprot:gb/GEZN01033663.1/.p1 GENE.gb/GEZN01033663.1/~~gb/GEZN01033663.1/.p1  ORF type:complete len:120 (-),score=13.77 gb/GEZN01033663.1/:42-359(-)